MVSAFVPTYSAWTKPFLADRISHALMASEIRKTPRCVFSHALKLAGITLGAMNRRIPSVPHGVVSSNMRLHRPDPCSPPPPVPYQALIAIGKWLLLQP